jgi:protein-tyrosine phosphatase
MFEHILVVCVGNICRSPMAQGLLFQALQVGYPVRVSSAGLGALVGRPADEAAVQLMHEAGVDISDHRARRLTAADIREADLILVMDRQGKQAVEAMEPSARGKVYRLGEWRDAEVPDPYQRPGEVFQATFELIRGCVDDWVAKLRPTPSASNVSPP